MRRPRQGDRGFSLIELLITIAIVGLLAAIAIPVTLSQRSGATEAAQQADLTNVQAAVESLLTDSRGLPSSQVAISSGTGNWYLVPAATGTASASGVITSSSTISGTVWTDGSYCISAQNTSVSVTYILRSDEDTPRKTGSCPVTAIGGTTLPSGSTVSLPPAVTGLYATSSSAGSISVAWNAIPSATGFSVKVPGQSVVSVTGASTTLTGIAGGMTTVTVWAKNATGAGAPASTNVTVMAAGAAAATQTVTSVTWNDLPLLNGWVTNNEITNNQNSGTDLYNFPQYTKSGGIVALRGSIAGFLGANANANAQKPVTDNNVLIATLPVGYRPDYMMEFSATRSTPDTSAYFVDIYPNGEVRVIRSTTTAMSVPIFLDGIKFPAAGTATWTSFGAAGAAAPALGTNWAVNNSSVRGPARYWKDTDGIVWLAGSITRSAVSITATETLLTLSSTINPWAVQVMAASSLNTLCTGAVRPDSAYSIPVGVTGGALIHQRAGACTTSAKPVINLDGLIYQTSAAQANLKWFIGTITNGGTTYQSGFTQAVGNTTEKAGYAQTSYGLVILQGSYLMTPTTAAATYPVLVLPGAAASNAGDTTSYLRMNYQTSSGSFEATLALAISDAVKITTESTTSMTVAFDGVAFFP